VRQVSHKVAFPLLVSVGHGEKQLPGIVPCKPDRHGGRKMANTAEHDPVAMER